MELTPKMADETAPSDSTIHSASSIQQDNLGNGSLEQRIMGLEREVKDLRNHARLSRCFWTLVIGHGVLFWSLCQDWEFLSPVTYVPMGGVGTLGIWYAWTNRSLSQRISRAFVASGAIVLGCGVANEDWVTVDVILGITFLLVGAMCTGYALTWFRRVSISPPGNHTVRSKLSIQTIMLSTTGGAALFALSHYVNAADLLAPFVLLAAGAMLGLITASVAHFVLCDGEKPVLVVTLTLIVCLPLFWLVFRFFDNITFLRPLEIEEIPIAAASFVCSVMSPAISFWMMKRCGYRLIEPNRA